MLAFNVTTPMEQYSKIMGRFGFSEENRHMVAMINYPKGVVGIEILLQISSITNFNTKFELATPVEFLQQVLVVGKVKPDQVDFRGAWNSLLVGFTGIWHYRNLTDFEYSYKVFTPLDGYEENGIVAKLIFLQGLDFELSCRLSDARVGVSVFGKPKPLLLKEMGIRTQKIYRDKLSGIVKEIIDEAGDYIEVPDYEDEEEEEDPISWTGKVVVDALVYPTITAEVDLDQKGTTYSVLGTIILPDGKANIQNDFIFEVSPNFYFTSSFENFILL